LMPAAEHLCAFLEASIQKGRRGPMSAMASSR
jgi:UDP-N-acetylglucosamine acyltransferase